MGERLKESPSQTAGPYVHIGCVPGAAGIDLYERDLGAEMITGQVAGQRLVLEGAVFDGEGAPVTDAMVEIWQADGAGRFGSEGFSGWGRQACDAETGGFRFETVKPGSVAGQAPHITLWIVARGINLGLQTRVYFADEAEANASDPVLQSVPDARRETLMAQPVPGGYRLDIHLQGADETVFFDI